MRVLGIDPGTIHCGYALLEDLGGRVPLVREVGTWHLGERLPLAQRLASLSRHLQDLVARQSPGCLSIEESFLHKNVHSAMVLGHGRGVILAQCALAGMEIAEYAPSTVKQTVAGSGRASKEAVADMVCRQLALQEPPTSADATDALAIALTHLLCLRSPLTANLGEPGRRSKGGFDLESYLERVNRGRRSAG